MKEKTAQNWRIGSNGSDSSRRESEWHREAEELTPGRKFPSRCADWLPSRGFNREGAKVSQGTIQNWWRQVPVSPGFPPLDWRPAVDQQRTWLRKFRAPLTLRSFGSHPEPIST